MIFFHVDYVIRTGTEPVDASGGGAEKEFQKRVRRRGSVREEQVKRRVGANVRKLEYKKLTRGG